jgi:hypothetical protein
MSTQDKQTVTLQLDAEAVDVFQTISEVDKEKLQFLVSSLFKEYKVSNQNTLKKTMDDISKKAQQRGLTPENLTTILDEEE